MLPTPNASAEVQFKFSFDADELMRKGAEDMEEIRRNKREEILREKKRQRQGLQPDMHATSAAHTHTHKDINIAPLLAFQRQEDKGCESANDNHKLQLGRSSICKQLQQGEGAVVGESDLDIWRQRISPRTKEHDAEKKHCFKEPAPSRDSCQSTVRLPQLAEKKSSFEESKALAVNCGASQSTKLHQQPVFSLSPTEEENGQQKFMSATQERFMDRLLEPALRAGVQHDTCPGLQNLFGPAYRCPDYNYIPACRNQAFEESAKLALKWYNKLFYGKGSDKYVFDFVAHGYTGASRGVEYVFDFVAHGFHSGEVVTFHAVVLHAPKNTIEVIKCERIKGPEITCLPSIPPDRIEEYNEYARDALNCYDKEGKGTENYVLKEVKGGCSLSSNGIVSIAFVACGVKSGDIVPCRAIVWSNPQGKNTVLSCEITCLPSIPPNGIEKYRRYARDALDWYDKAGKENENYELVELEGAFSLSPNDIESIEFVACGVESRNKVPFRAIVSFKSQKVLSCERMEVTVQRRFTLPPFQMNN